MLKKHRQLFFFATMRSCTAKSTPIPVNADESMDTRSTTIATPYINDLIIITHHGEKLAVVTSTNGTTMNTHFMKANGDVVKHHMVTIDSDKWRPISDADKTFHATDEEGRLLNGIVDSFDADKFEFTIKWGDDTEIIYPFNKFNGTIPSADADKSRTESTTAEKRPRADEEAGKKVRDYLTSIGLAQYADQMIELGLDDLNYLQTEVDLKELEGYCKESKPPMKPFHLSKLIKELNKFREVAASESASTSNSGSASAVPPASLAAVPASVALAHVSNIDGSGKTHPIGPSAPSVASLPSTAAPSSTIVSKPVPDYSQVDTSNYAKFVEGHPALQQFPKKFTDPKKYVDPYTYQMQLILGVLDTDDLSAPDSSILSIGTEFRGIGKSYLMAMMQAVLQAYPLTLKLADFNEIAKRRADPEPWWLFNERPFLFYDIDKDEAKVLGEKVILGPYLEALSNGAKCGGAPWNPTSRPIIVFIGNDHLTLKSLGDFSAHRVDFYSIMSVGKPFPNAKGITDFPDYKLVVDHTMMAKMQMKAEEQVQKGNFDRDASEANEDADVYIFLTYFEIVPYSLGQKSSGRMKAKEVATKLVELSKDHFASLLSASGASFHQAKWTAWYEAKKAKLGSVPIHMWDHANQPQLNVQLKSTPAFERN